VLNCDRCESPKSRLKYYIQVNDRYSVLGIPRPAKRAGAAGESGDARGDEGAGAACGGDGQLIEQVFGQIGGVKEKHCNPKKDYCEYPIHALRISRIRRGVADSNQGG